MTDVEIMTKNKLFGKGYSTTQQDTKWSGQKIVEMCYHPEAATDITSLAKREYCEENAEFVINCNHLFLKKAGMSSRLDKLITLKSSDDYKKSLEELYSRFILQGSEREINLSFYMRRKLKMGQSAICASHELLAINGAREECGKLLIAAMRNGIEKGKTLLPPKFKEILETPGTPIDDQVMAQLNLQQTNINDFLDSVQTRGRR